SSRLPERRLCDRDTATRDRSLQGWSIDAETLVHRDQSGSKNFEGCFPAGAGGSAGKTLCRGCGIGVLLMRSCQSALLSNAVSTASARLKSRFLPSFQSFVFIS